MAWVMGTNQGFGQNLGKGLVQPRVCSIAIHILESFYSEEKCSILLRLGYFLPLKWCRFFGGPTGNSPPGRNTVCALWTIFNNFQLHDRFYSCLNRWWHFVFVTNTSYSVADPGFPRGGGPNSPGGAKIRFCQIFPKTA